MSRHLPLGLHRSPAHSRIKYLPSRHIANDQTRCCDEYNNAAHCSSSSSSSDSSTALPGKLVFRVPVIIFNLQSHSCCFLQSSIYVTRAVIPLVTMYVYRLSEKAAARKNRHESSGGKKISKEELVRTLMAWKHNITKPNTKGVMTTYQVRYCPKKDLCNAYPGGR